MDKPGFASAGTTASRGFGDLNETRSYPNRLTFMTVLVHRARTEDDGDPPIPRRFDVPDAITVLELLARIRDADYLPSLPGGRATWTVEGERPVAVMTQEYREPWPLLPPDARVVDVAGRLPRTHFFFRHLARVPPEEAYRNLGGDPVRLGRDAFKPSREITWAAALRDFVALGRSRR